MEALLAGGGQGGEGAAVEGVDQSDDLGGAPLFPVFAGHLDSALVGLGAGVAEEGLAHARGLAQRLGQGGVLRAVVVVAQVLDLPGLLRYGGGPLRVAVAQGVDPDAGGEVDVLLPFRVPGPGVFALYQGHVHPAVGGEDIGFVLGFDLVECHKGPSR